MIHEGLMRLSIKVILNLFQLTCFGSAGYMVFVQLKTYFLNQDISTIAYENFENGAQDIFPTLSICAVGGIWILENKLLPKNHTTQEYIDILSGVLDDKLNYSRIQFENVTINVNKFISDFYTLTDTGDRIIRNKGSIFGKQNSNSSLEISHLDPKRICVTKEDFQTNALVEKDYIELNIMGFGRLRLRSGLIDLDFYIHQKGQLLRKLKYPNHHLEKYHTKQLYEKKKKRRSAIQQEVKIKVDYVDVLRKRASSNIPCDPGLQNEDNKIRHAVIDNVGCIPAFNHLFLNDSLLLQKSNKYPICTRAQYRRIFQIYENFLQTKNWYTQPCSRMNTIVATDNSVTETKGFATDLFLASRQPSLKIEFTMEYSIEYYRETVNTLAFDMATLWSQIGGFIGIFLGYSLCKPLSWHKTALD